MNPNKNSDVAKERAKLAQKEKDNDDKMAKVAVKIPISNEEFIFSELTAEELLQKKDVEEILARIDLLDKRLSDHETKKNQDKINNHIHIISNLFLLFFCKCIHSN